MSKKRGKKRLNIYFRQSQREFQSLSQTRVFYHINKNLPFKIYHFSRRQFLLKFQKMKRNYNKIKEKIFLRKRLPDSKVMD